jgi:hypothetical protein
MCGRAKSFVVSAKFALPGHKLIVGDLCTSCIRASAEMDIAMEKMDSIGVGYTDAVLTHGSIPLMLCHSCHKRRPTVLNVKPEPICASCFLYITHVS